MGFLHLSRDLHTNMLTECYDDGEARVKSLKNKLDRIDGTIDKKVQTGRLDQLFSPAFRA